MIVIGERINSSRKAIAGAIRSRDAKLIQDEATAQIEAGADYIDLNAAALLEREADHLKWLIEMVQSVTDAPLCIDTPDPKVMRAVLPFVGRPPMINSITLEPSRLEGMIPLVIEYKAKTIALCQSEDSMADTTEAKVELAAQLVERATTEGVPLDDMYVDPLVYPLGANSKSALYTLDAIEMIMRQFTGVHTICGVTNVSHGLPARSLINRTFLVMALARGLDAAIMDPTDKPLYTALKAALTIGGKDDFCMGYITSFREGRLIA